MRSVVQPVLRSVGSSIGVPFGGMNPLNYWKKQDEVLFLGDVSKVTDGKLYNLKEGATDYLTVTGEAGNYSFQCPNTSDYLNADSLDKLWFSVIDNSRRTVTTSELITWDFHNTPVRYDNDSPYTLRWIMILKSGAILSGEKRNKLFADFQLSVMWDNSFNPYGCLKGNKGLSCAIVEPLGEELILNGTFDTNDYWTESAKFTIHDGRAYYYNDTTGTYWLRYSIYCLEVGSTYRIEVDQYDRVGYVYYNYLNGDINFTNGHNVKYFVAGTAEARFRGIGVGSASFDNLSIRKVNRL
ncbi:MAG: hypothetical protein WBJ87_08400 [Candidatus Hydrothermia bacterium]